MVQQLHSEVMKEPSLAKVDQIHHSFIPSTLFLEVRAAINVSCSVAVKLYSIALDKLL